jgi:hypothetical protein
MENQSQFIIYQTENGQTKIDVRFQNETVWLAQKQLAELFGSSVQNINIHLKNIFEEQELDQAAVIKDFLITAADGKNYRTKHYNLDAIISVGYRIKSHTATRFRQWATKHLREYIVKGFVLNDERLKNPSQPFDYFEELSRRIQDIRTSEKRFYQKITDIYATSVDYDPTLDVSIQFFKTVQNKIHWAITGHTAAEIIHLRVDSSKDHMGLTNWRGEKIRKLDVATAKNYLNENELQALNNLTEQYLVFAEGQAMRRITMSMMDWITKLDGFLTLNDRDVLTHTGKVSQKMAKELAELEYSKFKANRQADDAVVAEQNDIAQLTSTIDYKTNSK